MLYRIVVDGTDILDYTDPAMVLLSPQLNAEIDVAGSLEFTVPPYHSHYDMFTADSILTMTVEVYEDSVLQWFGRPLEIHLDFYNNKKLYCEGGLSFFNDSIIREEEYDSVQLSVIFAAVIAEHNGMVPANRQFTIGNFTVQDEAVYRKFNYEQTSDVLKGKFLDTVEGHFFVRRVNGVNYIDFLKDMPYTCNQQVKFAENLLNFTYSFDAKDFATCVIPLGKTDSETNKPIDIKTVNSGSDILVGNTASKYGKIVKVQQYSDIDDPNKLKSEGQKYLTNLQYNAFLIECSAVDLHSTDGTQQLFRVGQVVHCLSDPHGINLDLPISKTIIYLDSAAKQITLGRIPKKTLARFYKEKVNNGGSGGIEESNIPEGWEIVPPDEDGGEPTLKRVPVTIQITRVPYKSTGENAYEDGETFDPTGIEVKLVATGLPNLTYFVDEYYPTSIVPMSELSFEINGSPISSGGKLTWTTARLLVWAIWRCNQLTCPYFGRTHRKGFYIENKDALAREAANAVDHIAIVIPPSKLDYYDGQRIDMSGAKVVAYTASGEPYTGSGYENGVIPNTELTLIPPNADLDSATVMKGEIDGIDTIGFQCCVAKVPDNPKLYSPVPIFNQVISEILWTAYNVDNTGQTYLLVTVQGSGKPVSVIICEQAQPGGRIGGGLWSSQTESIGGFATDTTTTSVDGTTIYYAEPESETAMTSPVEVTGDVYSKIPDIIARIIRGGGKGALDATQTIHVQWTPPGTENALETTFEINVTEHGGMGR